MYYIKTIDNVAEEGRKQFDGTKYILKEEVENPDGILIHSTPIHDMQFSPNLKSIVRIGAGVNTIPVDRCTKEGICVFNCPGGNANAVKELAIAALIMCMRHGIEAMDWVKGLSVSENAAGDKVEKGKVKYKGPELLGKTIGIIGVGAIGSRMAKACYDLGLKVYGYDPYLGHMRKSELGQYCTFVDTMDEIFKVSDIVTIHTPLNPETKGLIGAKEIAKMKDGVYFVNFARGPLVNDDAICDALKSGKIAGLATDFATEKQMECPNVVCTPHLGAGTPEADVNCSIMAAKQTMDYIENGNIANSVNLPNVSFTRAEGSRITIIHENKVGMLGLMTEKIATLGLNIENLVNKGRGNVAYTIFDFNDIVPKDLGKKLEEIDGVIRVRVID